MTYYTIATPNGPNAMQSFSTRSAAKSLVVLTSIGVEYDDAMTLRRIAMTLHRWHEMECNGDVERENDDGTGKQAFLGLSRQRGGSAQYRRVRYAIADRETGALKRLDKLMARYPTLSAYVQGDPRGAALYILRPGDVPEGKEVDSYYSRGRHRLVYRERRMANDSNLDFRLTLTCSHREKRRNRCCRCSAPIS